MRKSENYEEACFGAGCFWSVQSAFDEKQGVIETSTGFMGGHAKNPTYRDVCYLNTGHAEVVHLKFNPKIVSYQELLDLFFSIHDSTQYNRQGPDIGSQYRSVIFYYNEKQKNCALKTIEKLQKKLKEKIFTQVVKADTFYKAEEHHQKYLKKQGLGCCRI